MLLLLGFALFSTAENNSVLSNDEQIAIAVREDNAAKIENLLNQDVIPSVISHTAVLSKSIIVDSNVLHLALENDSVNVLKVFIENDYDTDISYNYGLDYNLIEYAAFRCATRSFQYLTSIELGDIEIIPQKLASIVTPTCPEIFRQIRALYPSSYFEITITEHDHWATFFKSAFVNTEHRNIFIENGAITITNDEFFEYWPKIIEHDQNTLIKPREKVDPLTLTPKQQVGYALENDDVKWLKQIIEYNEIPQLIQATEYIKINILHLGVVTNSVNSLRYLVKRGYDPFALNEIGENLLSSAAAFCATESYFFLKDLGLNVNHEDKYGNSVLFQATLSSCEEIYNDLISSGAKDFTLTLDDGQELTSRELLDQSLTRNKDESHAPDF